MRPTFPLGIRIGAHAEVVSHDYVGNNFELYRLSSNDSFRKYLLLAKNEPEERVLKWLSLQPRDCVLHHAVLTDVRGAGDGVCVELKISGTTVAESSCSEMSDEQLRLLFRNMIGLAIQTLNSLNEFPFFEKGTTWIAPTGSVAVPFFASYHFDTEERRVRELAKTFLIFASGISALKVGKPVSLSSWTKFASDELSRLVDACANEDEKRAIPDLSEIYEMLKSGVIRLRPQKPRAADTQKAAGLSCVAGMHSLKKLLTREVVEPLRNPEPYERYGLSIPNGILLFGPPGCGKTFIARQLAEELGHHFIEVIPSEVGSPYIHETSGKIRRVFEEAADAAPAVIFIDEFEALVPSRSDLGGHQQYKAEEVNEFLAHLNDCAKKKILVIAATNEPQKIDAAVRRTGRLDKLIYVGPPDETARAEMLSHHLGNRPKEPSLAIEELAQKTPGYSASDLRFLVDEAAREALQKREPISMAIFENAMKRVPASITAEVEAQFMGMEQRGTDDDTKRSSKSDRPTEIGFIRFFDRSADKS